MTEVNEKKLAEFLAKAKKATYAGGGEEKAIEKTGEKQLEYSEGDWFYRDTYSGSERFIGKETVSVGSEAVWAMLYSGGMSEEKKGDKEFEAKTTAFLKKALFEVTEESPFRGPSKFSEEGFEYENYVEGSLEEFAGEEKIFFQSVLVYSLKYSGGLVY